MTVGERIKIRRKELNISADQLAAALGVHRTTIFRYEKGEIEKFPGDALVPIAEALHTTPAYLMGWEDAPVKPKTKGLGAGLGALLGDQVEPPISEAGKRIGRLYDKADERDKHVVETVLEAYDIAKAKDA